MQKQVSKKENQMPAHVLSLSYHKPKQNRKEKKALCKTVLTRINLSMQKSNPHGHDTHCDLPR